MNNKRSCTCEGLKHLPPNTLIRLILDGGTRVSVLFMKISDGCLYGIGNQNSRVVIDCECVCGVRIAPPITSCTNPILVLDNPGPISCNSVLRGRVLCDGEPVPNVRISLSSNQPFVDFSPINPITNLDGEFSSIVTIDQGIAPIENVQLIANATVNNIPITNTSVVRAGCIDCTNPVLTLNPIIGPIGCAGTEISGTLICDDEIPFPIVGIPVFFTITSSVTGNVVAHPNPAITGPGGVYTSQLVVAEGVNETITISASATVGGIDVSTPVQSVSVNCPASACTCKFKLGTQGGGGQPDAQVTVTRFGIPTVYTGTLNINVLQCGSSINEPCDPSINNFNFEFKAPNGDTFNFSQGRRTEISCVDNTATVTGLINGRINNGPSRTFEATITGTLNPMTNQITWTIFATDTTIYTFQTTVPFTAPGSPQSFVSPC